MEKKESLPSDLGRKKKSKKRPNCKKKPHSRKNGLSF
jgi:hypothetical protein